MPIFGCKIQPVVSDADIVDVDVPKIINPIFKSLLTLIVPIAVSIVSVLVSYCWLSGIFGLDPLVLSLVVLVIEVFLFWFFLEQFFDSFLS